MASSFSSAAKAEVCRILPQKHCCFLEVLVIYLRWIYFRRGILLYRGNLRSWLDMPYLHGLVAEGWIFVLPQAAKLRIWQPSWATKARSMPLISTPIN